MQYRALGRTGCRCRRSASARGRSADRGGRWTTRSRCGAARGARRGRQLHRHRGRLRRRPQRAAGGAPARERPGETILRRDQGRPPAAGADARRLHAREPDAWVDRSLRNLDVDAIDLLQLHCPPSPVFGDTGVYQHPRRPRRGRQDPALRRQRRAHRRGARSHPPSRASRRSRSSSTCSGRRPAEVFFPEAVRARSRRPRPRAAGQRPADRQAERPHPRSRPTTIASSTATAKRSTRARRSRACPTTSGSRRSRSCAPLVPAGRTLAQLALRWTLMFDAVTCAIPGARTPEQARANAAAADPAAARPAHDGGGASGLRRPHPSARASSW